MVCKTQRHDPATARELHTDIYDNHYDQYPAKIHQLTAHRTLRNAFRETRTVDRTQTAIKVGLTVDGPIYHYKQDDVLFCAPPSEIPTIAEIQNPMGRILFVPARTQTPMFEYIPTNTMNTDVAANESITEALTNFHPITRNSQYQPEDSIPYETVSERFDLDSFERTDTVPQTDP